MLNAKTSALMLNVARSVLSDGIEQMSINDFLEMNSTPVVPRRVYRSFRRRWWKDNIPCSKTTLYRIGQVISLVMYRADRI